MRVASIKFWLARNIDHASKTKQLKDLPWDYEVSPDKSNPIFVSILPNTFRIQLNVFFDLCTELVITTVKDGSLRSLRNQTLLQLNDKIISAVGVALKCLAEEYIRALQSRHWSLSNEENKGGQDAVHRGHAMNFLCSVANDAYHIITIHTLPIKNIQTSTNEVREASLKSIGVSFDRVTSDALKKLSRLLFSDVQDYFTHFEARWMEDTSETGVGIRSSGGVIATIIATLVDYFADLMVHLEVHTSQPRYRNKRSYYYFFIFLISLGIEFYCSSESMLRNHLLPLSSLS